MGFTKAQLKQLRVRLGAVLDQFGEDNSISLELGNCSFTGDNATFKLVCSTIAEDGNVNTKESSDFKRYAEYSYGLSPDAIFTTFTIRGKQYQLVGCKPRSPKYPIIGKDENGDLYKFNDIAVRRGLDDKSLLFTRPNS